MFDPTYNPFDDPGDLNIDMNEAIKIIFLLYGNEVMTRQQCFLYLSALNVMTTMNEADVDMKKTVKLFKERAKIQITHHNEPEKNRDEWMYIGEVARFLCEDAMKQLLSQIDYGTIHIDHEHDKPYYIRIDRRSKE